jgi:hypothetical protein
MDIKKPYLIVGAIVPFEEATTGSDGLVRLEDRDGFVEVTASGYLDGTENLRNGETVVTVELQPSESGG